MWPKLTADWLTSLSVVTLSSAIVYWRERKKKRREKIVDVFIGQLEISRCCTWDPSDHSCRNKNKRRDTLRGKSPSEDFGVGSPPLSS